MHDVTELIKTKTTLGGGDTLSGYTMPGQGTRPRPRRLMIQDLMPTAQTAASGVSYAQLESMPDAPVNIPEGTLKTDAAFTGSHKQAKMRKAAFFQKITSELYDDTEAFTGFVSSYMALSLFRAVENVIWLEFLAAAAGIPAITPSGLLNDIQTAKSMIHTAGFEADGVLINPGDFENLRSGTGLTYGDVFGYGERGELGKVYFDRVLNLPVVESPVIPEGTILVGAFGGGSVLFGRSSGPNISISDSDQDDFVKNLITVRIEQRIAVAIFALPAFVLISGL